MEHVEGAPWWALLIVQLAVLLYREHVWALRHRGWEEEKRSLKPPRSKSARPPDAETTPLERPLQDGYVDWAFAAGVYDGASRYPELTYMQRERVKAGWARGDPPEKWRPWMLRGTEGEPS